MQTKKHREILKKDEIASMRWQYDQKEGYETFTDKV